MIKHQQLFGKFIVVGQIDFVEARFDLFQCRRLKSRLSECEAERIDVIAPGHAAEQGGFNGRRAPAHKRVVNYLAGLGEAFDEEARELRLETGAIGDFVQGRGLALFGGPEFVDKGRSAKNPPPSSVERGGEFFCDLAELMESGHGHRKIWATGTGQLCFGWFKCRQ